MVYASAWERLLDAVERIMATTGRSKDRAQSDLCQAIADGAIKIRGKLKHSTTHRTAADTVLEGRCFQIPTELTSEDLDWENSCPKQPWLIPRGTGAPHGFWYLEWIELFKADVTAFLCRSGEPGGAAQHARKASAAARSRPALERAGDAITDLYPEGVPAPASLPNAILCRRVGEFLKTRGLPPVSDDTILRAASRRRK